MFVKNKFYEKIEKQLFDSLRSFFCMLKLVENVCEKETKGFIVYKEELHMTEVKTITTEEVQERL